MCSVSVTADGSRTQTHWRSISARIVCLRVFIHRIPMSSAPLTFIFILCCGIPEWSHLQASSSVQHHSVHQYLLCSSVAVTITSIQILMASPLLAARKKSRSYVFTQKVRLGRGNCYFNEAIHFFAYTKLHLLWYCAVQSHFIILMLTCPNIFLGPL